MTTKVTVAASGQVYPARVVHIRRHRYGPQEVLAERLVASGETFEVWCSTEDTVTVTEEYHPEGYPPKVPE